MKKMNAISGRTTKMLLGFAPLVILLAAVGASSRGQGQISPRGIVTPLASANLVFAWFPRTITPRKNN